MFLDWEKGEKVSPGRHAARAVTEGLHIDLQVGGREIENGLGFKTLKAHL